MNTQNEAYVQQKSGTKKSIFSVIASIILWLILMFVVAILGYVIVAKTILKQEMPFVFGTGIAVVATGSMVPTLQVGEMVLIHQETEYHVDDIITFRDQFNRLVTHRLVGIVGDRYFTKGDANETPDSDPKTIDKIMGKVILHSTFLAFLISPIGLIIVIMIILCFWLLFMLLKAIKAKNLQAQTITNNNSNNYTQDTITAENNIENNAEKLTQKSNDKQENISENTTQSEENSEKSKEKTNIPLKDETQDTDNKNTDE